MCRHSWITPHGQAHASLGPAPCASPGRPLRPLRRTSHRRPSPAPPPLTQHDFQTLEAVRGRAGTAVVYSAGAVRFTVMLGGLDARAGLRLPGCPAAGTYPGVARGRAAWPRGAVLLLLLLLPPPAEAARPGPLPVLVAAAEPWGWAGAGGDGALTGKMIVFSPLEEEVGKVVRNRKQRI